ncbi:hypothetical protein ACVWYH_008069 [Bradyrhizobium sp. GM24.11]
MLHREERSDQIDAEHFLPLFDGLLAERNEPAGDAGVGPDHVEPAVRLHRLVDHGHHVLLGASIRQHRFRNAAGLLHLVDGLLHRLGAIDRDQPGAFFGEQQRSRAADAAAGAGDDDGFALQTAHAFLPLVCRVTLAARRNFKQNFKR